MVVCGSRGLVALSYPCVAVSQGKVREAKEWGWITRGVIHRLQCGYLLHRAPQWAAGGQPASLWSPPQAAG